MADEYDHDGTTLVLLPFVLFVIGVPAAFARLELMDWLSNIRGGQALTVGVSHLRVEYLRHDRTHGCGDDRWDDTAHRDGHLELHRPREVFVGTVRERQKYCHLGCSFITEGAIPYAAADSLRVIPSLMAGSMVAGVTSMYLDLRMPAPHGGLFVVPLANSPFVFMAVILFGSLGTAAAATAIKPDPVPDGDIQPSIQESAGD